MWYNDGTVVDGNDLQGGPDATTKVMGVYLNGIDQNVKVINNKIHNFHISNSITGSYIYGIMNSAQERPWYVNLFASNPLYDVSSNGIQHGISSRFALLLISIFTITPFRTIRLFMARNAMDYILRMSAM